MKLFDPKLPQLAPAIVWLAERGVGASRLAGVFGTTPGHIRVLAHRGRYPRVERNSAVITIPSLDVEPSPELRGQLGIRVLTRTRLFQRVRCKPAWIGSKTRPH